MNDSTKTLVGAIAALFALTACVGIMARCTVDVNGTQLDASECTKRGGVWHGSADPASRFCQEKK